MKCRPDREGCILMLRHKAAELDRFPKKSDFDNEDVNMIKAYLGPWPRALEAAGIKELNAERLEKKLAKRKRSRENKIRYSKEHSEEEKK